MKKRIIFLVVFLLILSSIMTVAALDHNNDRNRFLFYINVVQNENSIESRHWCADCYGLTKIRYKVCNLCGERWPYETIYKCGVHHSYFPPHHCSFLLL